jgi:hypothetical protein
MSVKLAHTSGENCRGASDGFLLSRMKIRSAWYETSTQFPLRQRLARFHWAVDEKERWALVDDPSATSIARRAPARSVAAHLRHVVRADKEKIMDVRHSTPWSLQCQWKSPNLLTHPAVVLQARKRLMLGRSVVDLPGVVGVQTWRRIRDSNS